MGMGGGFSAIEGVAKKFKERPSDGQRTEDPVKPPTDDTTTENGWDIFSLNRTMNSWETIDLVKSLNQASNERFPYVLNDGNTINFASDSNNSIGGYDL